jgi:amidase
VCGVFGLKPSRGRIFATRENLPGDIAVRFAVSRSVRDSAALLAASERSDTDAPHRPVGVVTGPSQRRLRIAFSKIHLNRPTIDPEVDAALDGSAALCRELGHTIVEATPALDGEEFLNHFMTIWASQPSKLASYAWWIGLTQLRIVRAADVLEPWTLGLAEWGGRQESGGLERAVAYMAGVTREFQAFFQDYDVLLTPVLADPPVKLGVQAPDVPFDTLFDRVIDYVGYTPQHNAAGTPAMSVPLSMSASGLPIGSQFAARAGDERTLLELAYQLEAARPWADRWAPNSAARL